MLVTNNVVPRLIHKAKFYDLTCLGLDVMKLLAPTIKPITSIKLIMQAVLKSLSLFNLKILDVYRLLKSHLMLRPLPCSWSQRP